MIIGLSGYARSGKDTAAQFLAEKGFQRLSFADGVREMLFRLNPTVGLSYKTEENEMVLTQHTVRSEVNEYGWEQAKQEWEEIRRLLQVLGTNCIRNMVGQDFWVDYALKNVSVGQNYVFTDVRFPNEAQKIKELGGVVWRIEREGVVPVNSHISEYAILDHPFDAKIPNTTLDAFKQALFTELEKINESR